MGLKADGTLWSWGDNLYGSGGTGLSGPLLQPTIVKGGMRWVAFAVGTSHALAIRSDGTAWAMGHNESFELGNTGGDSNGQAFGWGYNLDGEVGNGSTGSPVATPQLIGSDFLLLAKDDFTVLATQSGGSVVGWGDQFNGELARGSGSPGAS